MDQDTELLLRRICILVSLSKHALQVLLLLLQIALLLELTSCWHISSADSVTLRSSRGDTFMNETPKPSP